MTDLFIPVIAGTTRQARKSIHAAKLVAEVGNKIDGMKTLLVDPLDFNIKYDGNDESNKDPRYSKITKKADGFFIVLPEYNHGYPGGLKKLLDSELKNYIHKPVAFGGVSAGPWGGVRAIESLVPIVREMGMVATFTDVQFPFIGKIFDEKGKLQDNAYIGRIEKAFKELIWMTKALKWGRKNLESEYH
ncbi:MAG: NADPH-dependent FMN reductase [Nanoarchaeota archaeon]